MKFKSIKELMDIDLESNPQYTVSIAPGGTKKAGRISHIWKQPDNYIYDIVLSNGYIIKATGNHKFLLKDLTEILVEDLTVGDELASLDNVSVVGINKSEEKFDVYDVEIDNEYHNFLLESGVFVHNSRYTEMNLWPAAMELLKELPENAADMVPNYDGSVMEPSFLPARWPVAYINGVPSAMAVGFASNIPSHNPDEIMDACIALVKDPSLTTKDIMKIVKGPDFNCGCDIIATTLKDGKLVDGIKEYLETGTGSFIMKATYEIEEENGRNRINFYHLPYKIGPEKVIESIKSAYEKGHFKELESWKDLSDMDHPVNLEIITKKGVNVNKTLSDLFAKTPLQSVFASNITLVDSDQTPRKMSIVEVLNEFIEFRKVCTRRKLEYRLEDRKAKLSNQEAIKAVLVDIDKCISIIRNAKDAEEAKNKLKKTFKIDDTQANYILNLQLRKLTKSDSHEVTTKIKELKAKIKEIEATLKSDKKFAEFIASELEDTKKNISSKRKCKIIKREKQEEKEDDKEIYLTYSNGKIKRSFNKTDDSYKVEKDGRLLIITQSNRAVVKSVYELPDDKPVVLSRFKVSKALCAVANQGYLVLVGTEGALKIVDLSNLKIPNKDSIDKILSQNIFDAFVVDNLDFTIQLSYGDKIKEVKAEEIPMQSITANGKKFVNKPIEDCIMV